MSTPDPIGLFGATGYTGRLVAEALERLQRPWVAIGRDPTQIHALADTHAHCVQGRIADATQPDSLVTAFEGCPAIISAAGPFDRFGAPALDAAIAVGAHWTDTSAEQRWTLRARSRDHSASAAGVAAVPANGCIFAFHYAAAALLADRLGPLTAMDSYVWLDDYDPTRGTATSALGVADARALHLSDGRLLPAPARAHRVDIAGRSGHAAPLPGADVVLLSAAHAELTSARSWLVLSRHEAWGFALGSALGPYIPTSLTGLATRRAQADLQDPTPQRRAEARFTVVVRAHGPAGSATARIDGNDVYGITGDTVALTAHTLATQGTHRVGTVALGQALDAKTWLDALAPRGITVTMEAHDGQAHAA